jgi:hypothetical protein
VPKDTISNLIGHFDLSELIFRPVSPRVPDHALVVDAHFIPQPAPRVDTAAGYVRLQAVHAISHNLVSNKSRLRLLIK